MTSKTLQTAPETEMKQIKKADARSLLSKKIALIRALDASNNVPEKSSGKASDRFLNLLFLAEVETRLEELLAH